MLPSVLAAAVAGDTESLLRHDVREERDEEGNTVLHIVVQHHHYTLATMIVLTYDLGFVANTESVTPFALFLLMVDRRRHERSHLSPSR